jgi:16S rRNA processing protein RimM
MTLVTIGRIGRPHGVSGEVTLDGVTLDPAELESVGTFTWKGAGGLTRTLKLEGLRPVQPRMLARFAGVRDREQASRLTNGLLMVERERLPDPGPGVAYTFELIGLRVETEDGRPLGVLSEIMATGAHPVYVVRGERELLIPAAGPMLKKVDLEAGVITVALPAGLEDL